MPHVRISVNGKGANSDVVGCMPLVESLRWSEAEAALDGGIAVWASDGLSAEADVMIGDIHGSPEYRAHVVGDKAPRAVTTATQA